MENNRFENPKTAIIRLLRSQGCCTNEEVKHNSHLEEMKRYREELSVQTAKQRSKLTQIPCAITLSQEISELKDVIEGLGRQNQGRIDHLERIRQKVTVKYEVNDTEDQLEHERLQQEYANLLRTLESTNQNNRRLVERLARW